MLKWFSKSSGADKKPVVFVNSALSPEDNNGYEVFDYFVLLMSNLAVSLSKEGYDIILKVPSSYQTAIDEQVEYLEKFANPNEDLSAICSGIIIAPFTCKSLTDVIGKLLSHPKRCPVLTIDKGYLNEGEITYDVSVKHHPPYVICNEKQGGSVAAESFIEYYQSKWCKHLEQSVVIMAGLEGSSGVSRSKGRIDGFVSRFTANYPNGIFPRYIDGNFKRNKAKYQMLQFMENNSGLFNGVFCCNDEMALGVRDAFLQKYSELQEERRKIDCADGTRSYKYSQRTPITKELQWLRNVKIVGFDGISETKILLHQQDRWMLNTVDVNVVSQVSKLVKILLALHNPKNVNKKIMGIKHRCVPAVKYSQQNNMHCHS